MVILGEVADLGLFRPFDLALVRLDFAHQGFQQGGFAGAVGADDGEALAGVEQQVEAVEQHLVVAFGDIQQLHRLAVQLFPVVGFETDVGILAAGGFDIDDARP